jgi:hypothetical protein
MSASLYCGADGCTLHDYNVSPAFCEFQWQLSKKAELSETQVGGARRDKELAIQISESIVGALEAVLYGFLDSNETRYNAKNAKTSGETSSTPSQTNRRGGISI